MIRVAKSIGIVTLLLIVVIGAAAPSAAAQRASPAAVTGARAFAAEALGGSVGSALGIVIGLAVARPKDCPSLGATAGAAIGVGLEHLITEEMDRTLGDAGTVVLFSVTQGILAAAGSRLIASLRRN